MLRGVFWLLVVVFSLIMMEVFAPGVRKLLPGSFFLPPLIVLAFLGVALVILTLKKKVKGRLKKFLILTGAAAGGFFPAVFLHNLFYALGVMAGERVILSRLTGVLDVGFFLAAVFICPIAFLIGVIGSVVWFRKKR